MAERLPALMTVEEAARLLRVGRTKAYAMAREWRATAGRSGLPVVDFGHVLRVPRQALENLIGAELHDAAEAPSHAGATGEVASNAELVPGSTAAEPTVGDERRRGELDRVAPTPTPTTPTHRPHKRRQRRPSPNQATLPFTN